jgi:hypothetical protein
MVRRPNLFKYLPIRLRIAAQIWNELPNHFRQETSLEHFKNIIHTWNGSSCQCSAYR